MAGNLTGYILAGTDSARLRIYRLGSTWRMAKQEADGRRSASDPKSSSKGRKLDLRLTEDLVSYGT